MKDKSLFIEYLKTLKTENWGQMVTEKWTVKDVVAHMIGWERDDPETIRKVWQTKEKPWWEDVENYDVFNEKVVEEYKDFSPGELIKEWEKWQAEVEKVMSEIGRENLQKYSELFSWLFDYGKGSHYYHHLEQIKNTLAN